MKKSDQMRKLLEGLSSAKPVSKAKKAKKAKKIDADVNKDGKVDEKDLSLVKEAVEKVKKKIVKKKS